MVRPCAPLSRASGIRHRHQVGRFDRLPLTGSLPVDIVRDDRRQVYLVCQNGRVEEYDGEWTFRAVRFPDTDFGNSPYVVLLDDVAVCAPAGGATLHAFSRRDDQELCRVSLPYTIGRLYRHDRGHILASCVDGSGRNLLVFLDASLNKVRIIELGKSIPVYPNSDMQLDILDTDTLYLLSNERAKGQVLLRYSLAEEKITDRWALGFPQSRAWSLAVVGDCLYISGEYFLAALDSRKQLIFYRHVQGLNCNLLRLVSTHRERTLFCLCSLDRTIFQLNLLNDHALCAWPKAEATDHEQK